METNDIETSPGDWSLNDQIFWTNPRKANIINKKLSAVIISFSIGIQTTKNYAQPHQNLQGLETILPQGWIIKSSMTSNMSSGEEPGGSLRRYHSTERRLQQRRHSSAVSLNGSKTFFFNHILLDGQEDYLKTGDLSNNKA